MIICPNFSNPEVAREFEELKNATSEAAAYHIWSLNNGNAIDKAPNGAESKLFLTLLEYYKGDRTKAIQAKAKVYGNSFLNWFGDWTGNATYEVYQGRTSELPDGRRYNYWSRYENEAKTYGSNVRKVRINPTGFLFKNEQRWRTNLNGERVFDWGWSEEYEKVFAEFKEKTGYDYFDILENSKEGLAKQNEFFEFLESKGYKGYAEFNELELQGVEHDNAYTVTFGGNGVIDSDVSKVVDENGEPLVVWHGGAKDIRIFKHSDDSNTTTGSGYYTNLKTGEKIPYDSNNAMFFSSNRFVGTSYASLYGINTFSRIRAKVEMLIGYLADPLWFFKESGEGLRFKLLFKSPDKDLIDLLDDLSIFNSRFENLKNYYIQITSQNKKLNDNEKKAFRDMLILVRKTLYTYTSKLLMARSEREYVYDRAIRLIDEYNNPDGIKRLINGEIPETIKKEWELYKKIEQQREKEGKSKIANYEELTITLGEGRYYLSYNGNELSLWTPDYSDPKVSDMTEEQLSLFLTDAKSSAKYGILLLKDDEVYLRIKNKALEYPVFLNIKNPLVHDYEGTHQGQGYKESQKYPFGYVAARLVRKAILSGNDGVIYLNLYDPYLADNYGVMTPNQIKSIDNQGPTPWEGTYSRENDDIYYQENSKDVAKFNELYLYEYNTELKLLKTTDFNPFDYFKGRNYVILSERTSTQFNNYRSKVTKYKKDDKFGFPKQFFDEITGLLYIKSNNYKNSRRYDVVDSRTGEVVKHGVTLFTCDEFEKQSYKVSQQNRFVPKTFNARRAINFALLRQMPSKNRYKMIAKLFIYDSIDPKEATINFEIIDRFIDSMPDALWDYISSDIYGFNEDMYIGPFYAGTTDTSNINAATFKVGANLVSINLPKLGLITFAEKMTGIKLLGRNVKFNSAGRKLPNKNRNWNEEVVLDNNLTRPEIEYLIHQILEREYFKESTEKENIEHYAKHHGKTVDEVRKLMDFADEEFDDMVSHEMNHFIKHYDWLWIEFVLNIEEQWRDIVQSYIKNRYQDKFTTNDVNYIVQYFSGLLPWIKIDFNTDSYSGENEPFLRLFSVIHEPFHALHALTYGSAEEIALRNSYKELIKTPFGKKLHDLVKNSLTKNVDEEGLYKETCAYMFQIINTPSEFIWNGGDEFPASKIYKLIKDIIELPIEKVEKKVISTLYSEQEKEEYVKLSFFQKLYNAIISALHKIIPLTKQYIDLINNVVKVQLRVEVTTENTIIEETERSKLIQLLKNDFLTKLDEFEGAIKALQSVDDNVLSSVHVDDFFKKSKVNYQELQNLLDDLQKTERELNLKDYLKSLRNTLDC